jgi:hypothetical protein
VQRAGLDVSVILGKKLSGRLCVTQCKCPEDAKSITAGERLDHFTVDSGR